MLYIVGFSSIISFIIFDSALYWSYPFNHKVYRVPGFPFSHPNWPPPPHPPAIVAPLGSLGEGAGGASSDEGTDTLVL
jgi:hypothetical protein